MEQVSIIIDIGLRAAPNVMEQPRVTLDSWMVLQDLEGCFLVGVVRATGKLRFTTHVVEVNDAQRTWVTSSGRIYDTPGLPEYSTERRRRYVSAAKIHVYPRELKNVTNEFFDHFRREVEERS